MSERIIEHDGKRYRFAERRIPKNGEWYDQQRFGIETGRIINSEYRSNGLERDIYELIEEKPMKVTHEEPDQNLFCTFLCDMPSGSYGVSAAGDYFFHARGTIACLNRPGCSYSFVGGNKERKVRVLPPGTTITIEVE